MSVVAVANPASPCIGTHNGGFHLDEVVACTLLRSLERYKNSDIVRTRDEEVLKACNIVVDVGGVYDHAALRYDHHQREFGVTWSDKKHNQTRMSSAGLVWKHYGKEIIESRYSALIGKVAPFSGEPLIDWLHEEIYRLVFESIDASDNGVKSCECAGATSFFGGMPGLSAICSSNLPAWDAKAEEENASFSRALTEVAQFLWQLLDLLCTAYPDACAEILQSLQAEGQHGMPKGILCLARHSRFHKLVCDLPAAAHIQAVAWQEDDEVQVHVLREHSRSSQLRATFEPLVVGENAARPAELLAQTKTMIAARTWECAAQVCATSLQKSL